jgi:signal transduction histidine kinase/DNA-binding response OmpR family regulator
LLAIILILIGPLAVLQVLEIYQVRTTRARTTQERALELAKAGAARFQDTIDDTRTVLDLLSRVSDVTQSSPDQCSGFLKDTPATHQWARSLSLVDENQKVVCSTNPAAIGFDVSDRQWFQDARKTGGFNVSGFFVNQISGMPTTFAALFFQDGKSQKQWALIASLDLSWFDRIAAIVGEKQQAIVLLVDSGGVILSRYPKSPIPGNARISPSFLADISSSERPMFVGRDPEGADRLFASVYLPEAQARVVVGFDLAATLGLIDKFIVIAAVVFGGVMLLGGFVVWVIGDKIFIRPMEELNGLLRTTLETMDQGLIAVDRHGRSSLMNTRALDLLGLPRAFGATLPSKEAILEYQRNTGEFDSDLQYSRVVEDIDQRRHAIYERKRPNGTVLEVRTVPTEDGGFVRTYSDITARRAAEEALRREKDRAESAARATGEFLANMSHELRTPLTAIIGVSDMLMSEPQSPERQRHFLEMQRSAGRGLLEIINDILDFSKIEAGQLDIASAPFSIREIVQSCVALVYDQGQRKGLVVTAAVAGDVPEQVMGDAVRLRQILLNLVANGVKFTPSGSVAIRVSRAADAADRVCFAISDTGIGISAENLPTLFHRFSQADRSTTRRFGGSGLGLAISKRLVELMNSTIEVKSEPGQGSVFSFTLALPACPAAEHAPAPSPPPARTSHRLLLAEDNSLNRQLIRAMLEQAGHEVITVNDGAEAIRVAARSDFDAILMDVQMPEMDGYAATRAIRKAAQDLLPVPIIALTANALSGEAERCLAAGMDCHVPKPIDWPLLFATINRLVLERQAYAATPSRSEAAPFVVKHHAAFDSARVAELRHSIGDQNTMRLLQLFVMDAQQRFAGQPHSERDREAFCREAHAFAGSAGMFGFEELAAACAVLQSAEVGDSRFDQYLDRCRRARDAALAVIGELVIDEKFSGSLRTTA